MWIWSGHGVPVLLLYIIPTVFLYTKCYFQAQSEQWDKADPHDHRFKCILQEMDHSQLEDHSRLAIAPKLYPLPSNLLMMLINLLTQPYIHFYARTNTKNGANVCYQVKENITERILPHKRHSSQNHNYIKAHCINRTLFPILYLNVCQITTL